MSIVGNLKEHLENMRGASLVSFNKKAYCLLMTERLLEGRRDLYSKMMFKEIRDAREQEMDVLISKIYEINKPVVRKIVLRKI